MSGVCILDYGSGNVNSVKNAFNQLNIDSFVSNEISSIRNASHIVLPGVGTFGTAMQRIQNSIPILVLREEVMDKGKPYLGICVGMQVLAEWGHEYGKHQGLGWLPGSEVHANKKEVRQPHIGWNNVSIKQDSSLLNSLENETDFYFVHSYVIRNVKEENVIATTSYGFEFPSIIQKENIFGVQFHPEKSQRAGLKLIKNFSSIS